VSESIEEEKPGVSPKYLIKPTNGNGGQRINKRPLYLLIAAGSLVFAALGIATYVRAQNQQQTNAEAEVPKVVTAGTPPFKRPDGPDVAFPAEVRVDPGTGYAARGEPMREDEMLKQARQRKLAALDDAINSDTVVDLFKNQRSASGQPPSYNNPPGMPGLNGLIPPPPPGYGDESGEGQGGGDINEQASKRAFLKSVNDDGQYLRHTREAPLSANQLNAGSIIPGVLITGINSDLPGPCVGQVRQNVYDSATGRILLIPAGAKLLCAYDSSVSAGQARVLVAWNWIKYPDGSSLALDSMPGADKSGFAGFNEKVDNHYLRTFGTAFMLSLFSAATQLSQPRGAVGGTYNSQQIMAAALGQQLGMLGMQVARRNLSIQPTLEISPGYQFSIMVTKDIILPPWTGHPLAQNQAAP
jgi:type IV secretory pathway VirB10-like protein